MTTTTESRIQEIANQAEAFYIGLTDRCPVCDAEVEEGATTHETPEGEDCEIEAIFEEMAETDPANEWGIDWQLVAEAIAAA